MEALNRSWPFIYKGYRGLRRGKQEIGPKLPETLGLKRDCAITSRLDYHVIPIRVVLTGCTTMQTALTGVRNRSGWSFEVRDFVIATILTYRLQFRSYIYPF